MPFIVTTRREGRLPGKENDAAWSRRAVATLEEARANIYALFPRQPERGMRPAEWDDATIDLSELWASGGTVGPLPDGSLIEVEPVEWFRLYDESGCGRTSQASDASVIAAFNAKQAA